VSSSGPIDIALLVIWCANIVNILATVVDPDNQSRSLSQCGSSSRAVVAEPIMQSAM